MSFSDVSAIDREIGNDFAQRISQAVQSKVASVTLGKGDTAEDVCQHIQLTRQCTVHHNFLGLIEQTIKVASLAEERTINPVHSRNGVRVDKQAIHQVREVITDGAVDGAVFLKPLAAGKQFFNDDVDWP